MKGIKRIICLALAMMLLLGTPVRGTEAFTDVQPGAWYAEAVGYVTAEGLMNGVGGGLFAPAMELSRAMVVTVLHRLAGSPSAEQASSFTDVPAGAYYAEAVAWAYAGGIVSGTGADTFTPDRSITREEMVTLFHRFAGAMGLDTRVWGSLSGYEDARTVSDFAGNAFRWSVGIGLVNGQSETRLAPRGTANRAQFAVIIHRFARMWESGALEAEEGLVLHLAVVDGAARDLVSGTEFPGIAVEGEYIHGGTVTLPRSYSNWTCELIADYNECSDRGLIKWISFFSNSGKYEECGDVFKLGEVEDIFSRGSVRIPWVRDSWNSGYVMTIPVQIYTHVSADYEYLPAGDSFWSFSMDSDNGILNGRINGAASSVTMSTYTQEDGTVRYVDKIFPASFTLHGDHGVKELKFYDRPRTTQEQAESYARTGIVPPESGISRLSDGLTDLGSSYAIAGTRGEAPVMLQTETTAGTHSISDGNGRTLTYAIRDFVQPDNGIDNSIYESVHITNEPKTLDVGKQYPLSALPHPFRIISEDGKADEFDVSWESSDSDVLNVIDGLLIAKAPGTAEITATLMGTEMSDTVTITVTEPEQSAGKVWHVPEDYVSAEGDSFSDTDYAMTTRAIYAAVAEADENGIDHIIFPARHFYAQPITDAQGYPVWCYVPSGMTIEFPEGSVFHMMDNEVSRGDPTKIEIHYFEFGVRSDDYTGSCEDAHLIVDAYYGERYQTSRGETEYLEENRFVNFGRKAVNCTVEIRNAWSPAGYFIVADGTSAVNKKTGVLHYGDFVSGRLDENGVLQRDANWISTAEPTAVPDYGTDGYFLSADGQDSYAGKYWGGCAARLYDILWYDADAQLMQSDRFQGRGEYYEIPAGAAYFRLSLQQRDLPVPGNGETADSPWLALHDDGSAKLCEIKNTRVYDSACGLFSVTGQTDGLWVHGCYTNRDGMRPGCERTGDFENGWLSMRHSVVSNCLLRGYFGSPGGFHTFIHTNFITNYSGISGETELLRYINNTTDYVEISEKNQAHIYYNTLYTTAIDRFAVSNGHILTRENVTGEWVRSY